jgi:predicted site-specific integrase-resolvase
VECMYWLHKEMQQRFGVSRATINRYVRKGLLPGPVHYGDPQRSRALFLKTEVLASDAEQLRQRDKRQTTPSLPESRDHPPA